MSRRSHVSTLLHMWMPGVTVQFITLILVEHSISVFKLFFNKTVTEMPYPSFQWNQNDECIMKHYFFCFACPWFFSWSTWSPRYYRFSTTPFSNVLCYERYPEDHSVICLKSLWQDVFFQKKVLIPQMSMLS